jgi:hypothetical protein
MNADKIEQVLRSMVEREPLPVQKEIKYIKVPMMTNEMKRTYFNAGRAAAGARDIVARKAHAEMQRLEGIR